MTSSSPPRGRFAPTPSGRLHWGNLRTSLLAWLQIRKQGGTMVLRIEDVDRTRARTPLREAILQDLSWLGLDWDEGPDVGGAYGPYLQSERDDLYRSALDRLDVYRCICSRAQLRADREAGRGPACSRCRRSSAQDAGHWRWPLPKHSPSFVDLGFGLQGGGTQGPEDDPILLGADGLYRYTLAVVVDDGLMKIDQVCRGADLLGETPRQIQLAMALYGSYPSFFHVPLVLGPDKKKLSKSKGAPDLQTLRDAGAAPSTLIAALAQSCGLIPPTCAQMTARALLREIDLSMIYAVSSLSDRPAQEIPGQ